MWSPLFISEYVWQFFSDNADLKAVKSSKQQSSESSKGPRVATQSPTGGAVIQEAHEFIRKPLSQSVYNKSTQV